MMQPAITSDQFSTNSTMCYLSLLGEIDFDLNVTLKGGEYEVARGSVVKRSGSWYAVYRVDGKQKWDRAGLSKKSAERLLVKRMSEINLGDYRDVKKILFKDFSQKWLIDYARSNVKRSTLIGYEGMIRTHLNIAFGTLWLGSIGTSNIQSLVSQKIHVEKLSPKTVINILTLLREMFRHAKLWGYVRNNPTEGIKNPRRRHVETDFLTPEEITTFLQHVNPEFHALFATATLTGLRRGELLALKWMDIDFHSSHIIVRRSLYRGEFDSPKSQKSFRRVMITPMLQHILEQHRLLGHRSKDDLVFCTEKGTPLDPNNLVKREFHPALARAGLRRIRFHDLRHTFATLLIAQGENIKYVQDQLGHSSATVTLDRYGHLLPNTHTQAAERLDRMVFGDSVRKLLEIPVSEDNLQTTRPQKSLDL